MQQLCLIDPVPDDVREQIVSSLEPIYVEQCRRGSVGMYQDLIGRRSRLNLAAIQRLRGFGVPQADAASLVYALNGEARKRVISRLTNPLRAA